MTSGWPIGYYIDESREARLGNYHDPLCVDCAEDFAEKHGYDLDADYVAPIFEDSESDHMTACENCGSLIEHALTGDGEYTNRTVVNVHVVYGDYGIGVYFNRYDDWLSTDYHDITPSSYRRLMRILLPYHWQNERIAKFYALKNSVVYLLHGWDVRLPQSNNLTE